MKRRFRIRALAAVYGAGILSLAYILFAALAPAGGGALRRDMLEASRLMARAEASIAACREAKGLALDRAADPNGTGMIGLAASPLTTSLGNLEAKRTTTNPNFAGLAALLLHDAGVRRGDVVAVGASGSFPALVTAVLAAAKAMGLRPLLIMSLGASEWGANDPAFDWLDMAMCVRATGVLEARAIALSIGGDEDVGRGMDPAARERLVGRIRESGAAFLDVPDLAADVAARLELYDEAAGESPIAAFVNIGGNTANIGTDPSVLRVPPGLSRSLALAPAVGRGVLQEMAARGLPVIHFLNVRGLAGRSGLPWDPKPLPRPGEGALYAEPGRRSPGFVLVTVVFIAVVLALGVLVWRSR